MLNFEFKTWRQKLFLTHEKFPWNGTVPGRDRPSPRRDRVPKEGRGRDGPGTVPPGTCETLVLLTPQPTWFDLKSFSLTYLPIES